MNQTVNIDVQVQTKSLNDLENELAQINEELKDVAIGSDAFKQLSKDAQGLTKQLDKANEAAEGFTSDKKFMAADGAIKTMGGSLSGVVGTLGLLGVESEAFGEMEKKAASAIAVAMGVKDVSEGIKQMADANVLAAAKAKIMGMTTKQALIATGIGAFVVLLGTMIAYWDDIVAGVEKLGQKFPALGKVIDGIKDSFNAFIDSVRPALEWLGLMPDEAERVAEAVKVANEAVITEGGRELAMLQARGASAEELFKKKKEILEAELANLRAANEDQQAIYDKETELMAFKEAEKTRIHKEETDKRLQQQKDSDAAFLQQQLEAYEAEVALDEELNEAFKAMMAERKEEEDIDFAEYEAGQEELEDLELEDSLKLNQKLVDIEKDKQAKLKDARAAGLANVIAIAGAEGDVGKAAFIAQQLLNAKAMIEEVKKTITFSSQAAARSTVAVAEGTAQTAKVGFPQNIPLLIGYAAQAAGIIGAIRSAVKSSKGSFVPGTVPTTVVGSSQPTQNVNINPDQVQQLSATNQQTVKAYVVGGDVRSNSEAEAKIQNRRTLD